MISLNRLVLFAAIFCVGWGFGSKQKILGEGVQEKVSNERFGPEQSVFGGFESTAARVEVSWKDEKSTPPGWSSQKSLGNATLLDFDDISTTEPLTNITRYKNMTFSSFKVLNVPLALKAGLLDPEDANAATSAPNALLGSRLFSSPSQPTIPRIYVLNNCSSSLACSNPFPHRFQPISMSLKPLGFINSTQWVEMHVSAWELDGKDVVDVWWFSIIWFGPGRVGHGWLRMNGWGRDGRGVNVLQIKYTGSDGEDWRFAVDDLVVKILDGDGETEEDGERRGEL